MWRHDRLALNKEALALQVIDNFVPLLNEVGEDFVKRAHLQITKSEQGRWTADFTNELFRFALECEFWAAHERVINTYREGEIPAESGMLLAVVPQKRFAQDLSSRKGIT